MAAESTRFSISLAQSLEFARLSGDFNPMHVDPVRARRTQYGSSVVHGIHLLLNALEFAVTTKLLSVRHCEALSVLFSNPARTATEVALSATVLAEENKLRLSGESDGRALFVANLTLGTPAETVRDIPDGVPSAVREPGFEVSRPEDVVPGKSGRFDIGVSHDLLRTHFPGVAATPWGLALAADLLATTRIVGMECPGLHSIYSGLKLKRRVAAINDHANAYAVTKVDGRFRMVRMNFSGAMLEGSLETFLRPTPVEQPALRHIMQAVAPRAFQGQRALVVGGSRGLGELTAKILLAGDAQVTLTYARGESDARRICDEARALDRTCSVMRLDVCQAMEAATAESLRTGGFTHVYYFASPHIAKGTPGDWRESLFTAFERYYLGGFTRLLAAIAPAAKALHVLYPSTVFLDQPEKGFAEYCAAKAAGETLCDHLAQHYQINIHRPRLPRMKTDQTSGLTESDMGDPLAIMIDVLKQFLD